MSTQENTPPRVLILFFSLSGQSRGLVNLLAAGIRDQGVEVTIEQLHTLEKIRFPLGSVFRTLKMMLLTFFRTRFPIKDISQACFEPYDLVVLAGPTWSYNPSGPILSLLDKYGKRLFSGQRVVPLISCRGFYRLHDSILRRYLLKKGAHLEPSIIFTHPVSEPWSTFGVFLKSAGFHPERMKLLAGRYDHYGHSTEQLLEVKDHGRDIGIKLQQSRVSAP